MGLGKSLSLLRLSLLISSMGVLYLSLIALSRDFKVDGLATDPAHVNISLTFYWDLCFISTCALSIFIGIIFPVDGQEVCWPETLCCPTVARTASRGRPGTTLPGRGGRDIQTDNSSGSPNWVHLSCPLRPGSSPHSPTQG